MRSLGICLWCAAGKYSDAATLIDSRGECAKCPLGTFSTTRASSCTDCPAGSYADSAGSMACTVCPIGRILTVEGSDGASTFCERCPSGKVNDDPYARDAALHASASDCKQCSASRFSSVDRSRCIACPAGSYIFNASSCEWCTVGTYAPTAIQDGCIACAAGSATGKPLGASSCSSCNPGTFAPQLSENCTRCAAGKASRTRAETCTPCFPGRFAATEGTEGRCGDCAGGSATGEIYGSTACALCDAGRFQTETGQATCRKCPRGTYSSSSGSLGCRDCSVGHASNATGRSTACAVSNTEM